MDPLVALLLTDYNTYRGQTQHVHQRAQENPHVRKWHKMSPKTEQLLTELVAWCRSRQVEPRLWLFHLFKIRAWRFAPKLTLPDLCSDKALQRYKPMERLSFFRAHTQANPLVTDEAFDPNRDLTSSVEALKAQFQKTGQHMQCMQETLGTTLGFHPKSRVCVACPLAQQCAVQLEGLVPFSILAVRAGRLTAAQAEHISRRGGVW